MSHKTYVILLFASLFFSPIKAQSLFAEHHFQPDMETNEPPKMIPDTLKNIQLRISQMSNRMIWLQQKLKNESSLESDIRAQYADELSALIKERGDLMQITRQMLRSKNIQGKVVLF
jgi:predicted GH43/DUF377 family glycosyl hydrolase